MVVIDGPRFSTRAESRWYSEQGWSIVNMTGHPEAVLARELELCFATVALVTDVDAGVAEGDGVTTRNVFAEFERNIVSFKELVRRTIARIPVDVACACRRVHEGSRTPLRSPVRVC